MNDQLQQALLPFIEKLNQGADFAIEQVPDVVQQFLAWELWSHGIAAVLYLILLGASIYSTFKYVVPEFKKELLEQNDSLMFGGGTACCFGLIAGLVGWLINLYVVGMVLIAPKVFLLKELARMVN